MINIKKVLGPLYSIYYIEDNKIVSHRYQLIWVKKDFKYLGMALYPLIIVRSLEDLITINHEMIHIKQQRMFLIVFFYLIYGLDYLYQYYKYKDWDKAYYNICFEKEAFDNERNLIYNK